MSAFVVSDNHIHALVTFARDNSEAISWANIDTDLNKLGQTLLDENYRSVNHRYRGEYGDAPQYRFAAYPVADPLTIIKACDCLDYQSCESDDWKDTPAFKILEVIKSRAISKLPGYEKAPWGIK